MTIHVMGVRQLRDELAGVLDELDQVGQVVITQRGEGRAVLVQLDRYNELMERVDYLEDTLDALQGSREDAIPLDELA